MLSAKEIFNIFEEKRKGGIIDKDELCLYNLNLSKPKLYDRIKNSENCNYIVSVFCICDNCKMLSQLFDLTNYKFPIEDKELIYNGRKFIIERYTNLETFYININAHYMFNNNFIYGFVCGKNGYILKELINQKLIIDPRASELKKKFKIENILSEIKKLCLKFKEANFFNNNINSKCYKNGKIAFDNYYSPLYINYYNTPLVSNKAYLKNGKIMFKKYISYEAEDFGYFFKECGYIINFYMLIVSLFPYIDKTEDKFVKILDIIFSEEDKKRLLTLEDNYFQNTRGIILCLSNTYLNMDVLELI